VQAQRSHVQIARRRLKIALFAEARPRVEPFSKLQIVGELPLERHKGVAKVCELEPAIRIFIVSADKEVHVLLMSEQTILGQCFLELGPRHERFAKAIRHLPRILQIEVSLKSEAVLHIE